jgi:hypothetical protein
MMDVLLRLNLELSSDQESSWLAIDDDESQM